jgi:hypothetical protein
MQVEETRMTSSSRSQREFITCFFHKSQALIKPNGNLSVALPYTLMPRGLSCSPAANGRSEKTMNTGGRNKHGED